MNIPVSLPPLLQEQEPLRVSSLSICRGFCSSVKQWWQLTTNKAYLCSWLGRRPLFGTMLGVTLPISFLVNVTFWSLGYVPAHVFLSTGVNAVMLLSTKCLPIDRLWSDVWLGCCSVALVLLFLTADNLRRPYGYGLLPSAVFVMFSIGIHSSVIAATTALLIASFFAIDHARGGVDRSWVVQSACWGVVACVMIVPFELLIAQVFSMMQEQLVVRRRVLEEGSSGFLALDVSTGRIANASSGVTDLLGPDVLGRQLVEFVSVRDRTALRDLYQSETPGGRVLSTFRPAAAAGYAGAEFDAYVLAYHVEDGSCHIPLQVAGEVRIHEEPERNAPQRQRAPDNEGRALAERVWVSVARSRLVGTDAASSAPTHQAVLGRVS